MKKVIIALLIAGAGIATAVTMTSASAPDNSTLAAPNGAFSLGSFPLYYTNLDTVAATASDSMKVNVRRGYVTNFSANTLNSITYTTNVLKVAGTPTVTVALYGSANNGVSYDPTALLSYTCVPSSLTVPVTKTYAITGNPYTDYVWVSTGTASATISVRSYMLIR